MIPEVWLQQLRPDPRYLTGESLRTDCSHGRELTVTDAEGATMRCCLRCGLILEQT